MNVSASDILKGVVTALAISFLIYMTNVTAEALLKRFDVGFQHTVLLDKAGYIFQFDNPTWSAIESITIGIRRRLNLEATSVDNGVGVKIAPTASFTSFTLSDLPPNRRTIFLLRQTIRLTTQISQ